MLSLKRWEQQFLLMDGPKRRQFIFAVASRCLSNWPSQNTRPSSVRSLDHGKRWCRGGDSRRRIAQGPGQARGSNALLSARGARREARLSAPAAQPRPGQTCAVGAGGQPWPGICAGPGHHAARGSALHGPAQVPAARLRAVPCPGRHAGQARLLPEFKISAGWHRAGACAERL